MSRVPPSTGGAHEGRHVHAAASFGTPGEPSVEVGPECPGCGEPWLRPSTNLPGRYRCVYCLRRFELRSDCPDCGNHSTIARMSDTANLLCRNCGGSMLREI